MLDYRYMTKNARLSSLIKALRVSGNRFGISIWRIINVKG
jgi:hypothetical protein